MEDKVIKRIYTYHLSLADGTIVKYDGEGLFHNKIKDDMTQAILINSAVITHIEEIVEEPVDEFNKPNDDYEKDYPAEELTEEEQFVQDSCKKIEESYEEIQNLQVNYINKKNPSIDYIKACNDDNPLHSYDVYSIDGLVPYCFKHNITLDNCFNYVCHKEYQDAENKWEHTKYGKIPPFMETPVEDIPLPAKSNFKRKKNVGVSSIPSPKKIHKGLKEFGKAVKHDAKETL